MAMPVLEQEWEALPELELEGEGFLEGENFLESEMEAEQFFGQLARLASSPALRRIGGLAARAALRSLTESELEGESEGEFELEGLGELEGESETEYELNPIRRVYADAMMEHLAHAAMEAESEQEAAEQFFPLIGMAAAKLLPLAAKALPSVMKMGARALPKIMKVAPKLTRGVSNVSRTLYRNRRTRPLLRTVPTIANNTVQQLARQAARGQPITSQRAVRTLAQQANQVLSNPQRCAQIYRRSRALDRQAHVMGGARSAAGGQRCPTCGQRRAQQCSTCGR